MFLIFVLYLLHIFLAVFMLGAIFAMIYTIFPIVLFFGGPYVVTREEYGLKMVELTKPKKGEKMLDLGSGDGRIVITFAKLGINAYGYEINPHLVSISKKKIAQENLNSHAFVSCKNFWHEDLSNFDIVTIYPAGFMVRELEKKLKRELRSGTRIVLNGFKLPNWELKASSGQVYLYEKE
jgi:ubiquinone/menaquinone biosynthesis C-methylase UbiE